jgi:hypothetical protein
MAIWGETRRQAFSELSVAAVFVAAAVSIACEFPYIIDLLYTPTARWVATGIAVLLSPFAFMGAAVLVFFRPRFGYGFGLAASVLALPWFIQAERARQASYGSSWIVFNGALERGSRLSVFIVLSVAAIVVAATCAALRLLPDRWTVRNVPLRERTWPAFAAAFLVLVVWLFHSAIPYKIPLIADGPQPRFQILHVQKRGLHFQEVEMSASRDGRFYISRSDRSLPQYKFGMRVSPGVMSYEHIRAFIESPELGKLSTPPTTRLRQWNAEAWYVVLQGPKLLVFSSEYQTAPPQVVTDMFSEIEKLPVGRERTQVTRDVCMGFCYHPLAALGLDYGMIPTFR